MSRMNLTQLDAEGSVLSHCNAVFSQYLGIFHNSLLLYLRRQNTWPRIKNLFPQLVMNG